MDQRIIYMHINEGIVGDVAIVEVIGDIVLGARQN
jgi:hypothetical protein